jgi:hypothetical protein
MCFTLGNMAAKHEQARVRLFQEKDGIDTLLMVLKTYNHLDIQVGRFPFLCLVQ